MDSLNSKEWARYNSEVIWIDDAPWLIRNKMLLPMSMPHKNKNINREKVRKALSESKALLAHWSDDWDRSESEWWWTCCDDKNYCLENIKSANGRRGIQKGLAACTVSRIEAKDFANLSYKIYSSSLISYGVHLNNIPSLEKYKSEVVGQSRYKGFELWGAFVNNELAAYTTCIVLDNAVSLGSTKSDPDYHKFYPNNALFYWVTKHYLQESEILYITNGFRTLLHPTSINDFLIRMGYRKIFCRLNLELSVYAKMIFNSRMDLWLKYLTIFEKRFPQQQAKIRALFKIFAISKSFQ